MQFDLPEKVDRVACVNRQGIYVWEKGEEYTVELNSDSLRLCRGVRKRTKSVRVRVLAMVKQRDTKNHGGSEVEVVELA